MQSIRPIGYTYIQDYGINAFNWRHTVQSADIYLHAVIFIIHVLDPRNELTSVEAISHRFVLITLRMNTKSQHRLNDGISNNLLPEIKLVITDLTFNCILIYFLPGSLMAYCILQSPTAWCRRWRAQPDWLLSLLLCNGPLKPPAHMKQSASPVNSKKKT